jgi:hypothetical protein
MTDQWLERALDVMNEIDARVGEGLTHKEIEAAADIIARALQVAVEQERERAIEIADGYCNDFHRKAMAAAIRGQL